VDVDPTNQRFAPPRAIVEKAQAPEGVRLHRLTSIALSVLFGGSPAGAWLVISNSLLLRRRRDAWIAAALFGALGVATYLAQRLWPSADFPSEELFIGFPRLAAAVLIASLMQHRSLRAHKLAGGAFRSRWFGLLVGVGVLAFWFVAWTITWHLRDSLRG
jgi:phosphatidylserine synthase